MKKAGAELPHANTYTYPERFLLGSIWAVKEKDGCDRLGRQFITKKYQGGKEPGRSPPLRMQAAGVFGLGGFSRTNFGGADFA